MEPVLHIIVQFYPDTRTLSLVSPSWYSVLRENMKYIVSDIRSKYPAITVHRSIEKVILVSDRDTVNKATSISTYLPVNWAALSKCVGSGIMTDTIAPRISVQTEIDTRNRLKIPMDFTISVDDLRAHLKLHYRMRKEYRPINEPKEVIKKVIDTFGLKDLPWYVTSYLLEKEFISSTDAHCPKVRNKESSSVGDSFLIDMNLKAQNPTQLHNLIANPLCVSMNDIDIILREISPDSELKGKIRRRALAAALVNGWDYLLDEHLTLDSAVSMISSVLLRYPISERSWKYLEYSDMSPKWYRYYCDLEPKPSDLDPVFWKDLLMNAVIHGNIPLIKSVVSKHRNRIDRDMELKVMNTSRQYGTYSNELMSIIIA